MKVYLSGHLKAFTGGETEVRLGDGPATVGDALIELWSQHPALRERVLNEQGEIRTHVNVFLGDKSVKQAKGLETAIDADELHIFNAVSGG
ncbi:MAG TPA: MoaD/ThiS family protein [Pyrinomonadaceae bacterium]|nr:MoaD/ThiS family protein [Chloracidobacterium sp.]HRJ89845.1 MoaD/ThiS family protein [Pyrinomonadaceae bacterium]HRK51695.1 MoaD/ThiS family protein [Pyrinomonadaceae bacterium]